MTVTLADIKKAQDEHRELLRTYDAKIAERDELYRRYEKLQDEIYMMSQAADDAKWSLRELGAKFALQIEDSYTPKLPGTDSASLGALSRP